MTQSLSCNLLPKLPECAEPSLAFQEWDATQEEILAAKLLVFTAKKIQRMIASRRTDRLYARFSKDS